METLSTGVELKGIVVSSHIRILGEKARQCAATNGAPCYMGQAEHIDISQGPSPDDVSTKVTYFCHPAQRQECGDLIVEAAVALENTRK